jgi:hypothetical protein
VFFASDNSPAIVELNTPSIAQGPLVEYLFRPKVYAQFKNLDEWQIVL